MSWSCLPVGCSCSCHRFAGVSHLVACCDRPPYQPECNGICLTGSDIGIPSNAVAYAHPDCDLHGRWATHNVDGSPRYPETPTTPRTQP